MSIYGWKLEVWIKAQEWFKKFLKTSLYSEKLVAIGNRHESKLTLSEEANYKHLSSLQELSV